MEGSARCLPKHRICPTPGAGPDTEVITATSVAAGNTGDAAAAGVLLAQEIPTPDAPAADVAGGGDSPADQANTQSGHADGETERRVSAGCHLTNTAYGVTMSQTHMFA